MDALTQKAQQLTSRRRLSANSAGKNAAVNPDQVAIGWLLENKDAMVRLLTATETHLFCNHTRAHRDTTCVRELAEWSAFG